MQLQNTAIGTISPGEKLMIPFYIYKILEQSDVRGLIKAADVSKMFRSIAQSVIGKKKVSIGAGVGSASKVFKVFGKHITKLKITEWDSADYPVNDEYTDFDKFLKIIIKYGSPGKLVELEIGYFSTIFGPHTIGLLHEARPFFKNVTKLILNCRMNRTELERMFSIFPLNNLRKIYTKDFIIYSLNLTELKDLEHLYLGVFQARAFDFSEFHKCHRNLKSFYCHSMSHFEMIDGFVSNIENIGLIQSDISRFQLYHLSRFNKLKHIAIDVKRPGGVFQILDFVPNTLEMLTLEEHHYLDKNSDEHEEIKPKIMEKFTNLKGLNLHLIETEIILSAVLPYLNNVKTCSFYSCRKEIVIKAMLLLKNVRFLILKIVVDEELYQELKGAWEKRQQEGSLGYELVIYLPSMTFWCSSFSCRSIYNKNIVCFKKCTEELRESFKCHWF